MTLWWALVNAEAIKARRSAPLRLAFCAPALLFILELLTLFARHQINQTNPVLLWRDLLSTGWTLWLGLFTPALIMLETVCLVNVEHSGKHWKQLFALPIPRWRVFSIKMLFCGLLLAASFAIFLVTSIGGVLLFSEARDLHLAGSIPWRETLSLGLRTYAACWLLIVVHTWISVRFPGFAVSAGVAFSAMLVGFPLANVSPGMFGWWYPWMLPLNAHPVGLYDSHYTLAPAVFGCVAGALLAPLASWNLSRRQEGV